MTAPLERRNRSFLPTVAFAIIFAVCGGTPGVAINAQTPGDICGTAPGCKWAIVTRITPGANPCDGVVSGCSGSSPDCGNCFPDGCTAVRSRFGPSTAPPLQLLCTSAPSSSCADLNSSMLPFVVTNSYPCKLGATGCICRDALTPTVVPCPGNLPTPAFLPICY